MAKKYIGPIRNKKSEMHFLNIAPKHSKVIHKKYKSELYFLNAAPKHSNEIHKKSKSGLYFLNIAPKHSKEMKIRAVFPMYFFAALGAMFRKYSFDFSLHEGKICYV